MSRSFRIRGLAPAAVLAGLALAVGAGPAAADTATFANFQLSNSGTKPFTYTVDTNTATGTLTVSAPVTFTFTSSYGLTSNNLLSQQINGTLNFTISTLGDANVSGGSITQGFGSGTTLQNLTITANGNQTINGTGVSDGSTLLNAAFHYATITVPSNGTQGPLVNFDSVTYSSNYIALATPQNGSFTINLSSFTPSATTTTVAGHTLLANFISASNSTSFSANLVPEPATVTMFAAGLALVPVLALRRRKAAAAA